MRYQEPIYIQNENNGVRNKDILNVNMSSDLALFQQPSYSLTGATKIDCTGTTSAATYIITASTETIDLGFIFTGNTNTFIETDASFNFEIYKYTPVFSGFSSIPVYKSVQIPYSAFSATNSTMVSVPVSGLTLDGDYLVKPYYKFIAPTDFIGRIGKTIDTRVYISGTEYGLYDKNFDYHFVAFKAAETPLLTENPSNLNGFNTLTQNVIIPVDNQTVFNIPDSVQGYFIVTLNGLVLANDLDYTVSGNVITMVSETYSDDTVTVIYISGGGYKLVGDNYVIDTPIVSGITDNQGINTVYYNTTNNKYELYTTVTPKDEDSIIVMINGATLANGIDFYQSISNPKRIILEGDLMIDDIITIVYYPRTSTALGLNTNSPVVSWSIQESPKDNSGEFIVEVANDINFTSLYYSGVTNYEIGVNYYYHSFTATGTAGTTLYYRVKNEKRYTNICGETTYSIAYSETIPLIIQTNSINSY
jgi:hypothetical protein